MTEITYELEHLGSITRAMRNTGTHPTASSYEEVYVGTHRGIDVWAGIDYGNYPAHNHWVVDYLKDNYTTKQLKNYENLLSVYVMADYVAGRQTPKTPDDYKWCLVDVNLYFYVYGVEVSEHYTIAKAQEFGFSPEANLISLDTPQAFGLLDVVKNALRGREGQLKSAVDRAYSDAWSMAMEMTKRLSPKLVEK